jgi:hypothetical protein
VSTKDGTLVDSRVIDDENILDAYSVTIADMNQDGQIELIVNNHETSSKTNGIWAYKQPKDIMNDEWTRETIATGFKNAFSLFVPAMSPGFPYPIWPHGKDAETRAHIFVAGDGDYKAHDFYAGDEDFVYEDNVIMDAGGTVGALEFSDLDEDGWIEMWMPNYDKSTVEVFRFHEASTNLESEIEKAAEGFFEGFMNGLNPTVVDKLSHLLDTKSDTPQYRSYWSFLAEESNDTCTAPGEFCCEAPMRDVNNCPDSARTSDCDAKASCCCY